MLGSRPGTVARHARRLARRATLRPGDSEIRRVARASAPGSVLLPLGRVAEWQTRWLQVPVRATSWGFKSPLAHGETPVQLGFLRVWKARLLPDFYPCARKYPPSHTRDI